MGESSVPTGGRTVGRRPGGTRARRAGRWLRWLGLAVGGLLGLVLIWQHLAGRRPAPERERLAVLGRRVFARECAVCHGPRMEGRVLETGVRVPPLNKPGFRVFFLLLPAAMESWVREQIAEGNAIMPGFGPQLDAESLDALALYLRLVNAGALRPG